MPQFNYPCPECRTTNSVHKSDCRFEGTPHPTIEKVYVDILSILTTTPMTEGSLQDAVHGGWGSLHTSALGLLKAGDRIEVDGDGLLNLLTAAEYEEQVSEPTVEPIATVYQHGSVPGCHDNAVFAMVAWYEMLDFSWEETKEHVIMWVNESGTWDNGGFEESSPEELVEKKRHVYEEGYGWKQAAQEAKAVIERDI